MPSSALGECFRLVNQRPLKESEVECYLSFSFLCDHLQRYFLFDIMFQNFEYLVQYCGTLLLYSYHTFILSAAGRQNGTCVRCRCCRWRRNCRRRRRCPCVAVDSDEFRQFRHS